MLIIYRKRIKIVCPAGAYGLVKREVSRGIVHLVDERFCVEVSVACPVAGEGEKQTSIDAEVFNIDSSYGWQILIIFEAMKTTGTIFVKKEKKTSLERAQLHEPISHEKMTDPIKVN